VELSCSTGSYHERVGLALGQMWEDALGVRSRVAAKESKVFNDDLADGAFMVARGFWFGDYADPTTFLNVHRTGDGNNDRGYSDPEFDALMAAAERERDPGARMALLGRAEWLTTARTLPLLPIFHPSRASLFDPDRISGVSRHPRLLQHYWEVEVRRGPVGGAEGRAR
jgi:oligopeptide transport system substrate-binding protein